MLKAYCYPDPDNPGRYIVEGAWRSFFRYATPETKDAVFEEAKAYVAKFQKAAEKNLGRGFTDKESKDGVFDRTPPSLADQRFDEALWAERGRQARGDGSQSKLPPELRGLYTQLEAHQAKKEQEKDPIEFSLRQQIAKHEREYADKLAQQEREQDKTYQRTLSSLRRFKAAVICSPHGTDREVRNADRLIDLFVQTPGMTATWAKDLLDEQRTAFATRVENANKQRLAALVAQQTQLTEEMEGAKNDAT
jgi:hypothetical protein